MLMKGSHNHSNGNFISPQRSLYKLSSLSVKDLAREASNRSGKEAMIDYFGGNSRYRDSNFFCRVPDAGDEELMRFPSHELHKINIENFHIEETPDKSYAFVP